MIGKNQVLETLLCVCGCGRTFTQKIHNQRYFGQDCRRNRHVIKKAKSVPIAELRHWVRDVMAGRMRHSDLMKKVVGDVMAGKTVRKMMAAQSLRMEAGYRGTPPRKGNR